MPNPNAKWKSTSPYKTRSQLEVPQPDGVTTKSRLVLQSLTKPKSGEGKIPLEMFFGLRFFFKCLVLCTFAGDQTIYSFAVVGGVYPSSSVAQGVLPYDDRGVFVVTPPPKIIEDMLDSLNPEGFELVMVPSRLLRRWEQALGGQ